MDYLEPGELARIESEFARGLSAGAIVEMNLGAANHDPRRLSLRSNECRLKIGPPKARRLFVGA